MNIRKCTTQDLDILIKIGIETYYDTFHEDNSEQLMSDYLEEAFQPSKILNEINTLDSHFFMVEIDERPAAYLKVNLKDAQTDLDDSTALEIERIYVLEVFKGMGIGKYLMNYAFKMANNNVCPYVWLGVWEHNDKARRFYDALGFYKIGSHLFMMGDDPQKDDILRKDLT